MTEIEFSDNIKIPSDLLFSMNDLMLIHDACEQLLELDEACYDSSAQSNEVDEQHSEFIDDVADVMKRIHDYLDSKGIHEICEKE